MEKSVAEKYDLNFIVPPTKKVSRERKKTNTIRMTIKYQDKESLLKMLRELLE